MRTSCQGLLMAGLFVLRGLTCLAQTNVGPYSSNSASLIGARVASVNYGPDLQVYPFRILGGEYWTDSTGRMIPWAASIPRDQGDKHYRFTRVIVGQVSITLPMAPAMVGLFAILILAGGLIVAGCFVRRGR